MTQTLKLGLILTLIGTVSSAGSWTTTTSNGGSGAGTYACERSEARVTCSGSGSFTDRTGQTRSWERERLRTPDSASVTRNVTRRNGSQAIWTRTRTR